MSESKAEFETLLRECVVRRTCGSGPGGQHRNRTQSRIDLHHLPTGLRVTCDETRSQHQNLFRALRVLAARIEKRKRVRTPRVLRRTRPHHVKEKILREKRHISERKRLRGKPTIE